MLHGTMRTVHGPAAAAIMVTLLAASGCGASSEVRSKEVSHVRAITALYQQAAVKLNRNPANKQEFKTGIAQSQIDPQVFGVGSTDELFVSERDGKPLVIIYGTPPKGIARELIVYEQEGVEGVRRVGFKLGKVEDADAARFAELVPTP
jgi:hypothetical protein